MSCRFREACLIACLAAQALLVLLPSCLGAADPTLTVLPFHAIDAEGDPAHSRIVLVAESTGKIYTWDTQNGNLSDCDLPAPPTCVSVSPDGMTAVVGHDHSVTLVDLGSMTQIASWYCSANVSDIVHGGNGYAYAFPNGNDVDVKYGIRLSDGEESPQLFCPVHDDTRGRLRPGTSALYEITASVPDYIAHLSIAASPIQYEKQSQFGGYGDNIWFNDQGTLILSSSGKTCRANDNADDLDYVGHLPASTGSIVWADHGGSGAGWFAAIPSSADTRIDLVNADLLDLVASKSIPGFSGGSVPAHGRWVFLSQDGNTAYVVAEASPAAGLSDDQGIATIDLTPQPGIVISSPAAGATLESRFPLTYRTTDWPPPAGGSVSWLLDGVEQGVATNPLQLSGLAIGDHTIRVELRNHLGAATGVADSITVHVLADQPDVCRLTSDVVDAEGDLAHDRLILVSASPPRIHRWNASTNDITSCGLPIVPTCLSVSPDGSTAVIGHDSRITLVDLGTMTQIATWSSSSDIFDIVHGGNGHAYVFPRTGGVIHCIDLGTGGDTGAVSWQTLYSGTRGRLRPGSAGLYVASEHPNPGFVELYDVAVNPAQYLRRSPVTGISSWGSNLWFNRMGTRIISQTGFVYQASGDASVDMAYTGHLPVGTGNIAWVDHGGSGSGRYAAIPAANDTRIDLINAEFLDAAGSKGIPSFASLGGPVQAHGRWVFLSPDGNTAYVVARAGAGAGLINDHGIATIDVTPQPGIDITSPASDATLGSSFTVTYRTTAWPPPPGGSVTWSLDGIAQGAATNPLQLSGLALGDHTVQLELRDHLGATTGVEDSIAVHVLADQPDLYRLTTDVVDAEGVPTHGWVILASASPPRLHRWEAATQVVTGCALPAVPTCVSVSPDGATAVVGHDSRATLVDLATMTQVATWTCAVDAFDIVHGGDGYAYLFARSPDWGPVHRLNLSSGTETSNSGSYIQAHTHARLCPGKPLIYDATNLSSPSRLNCTYIGEGTVQHLRTSPSQADAPEGGLWFNRQGTRIITRSGNLYQASGDASVDMSYAGQLPVGTGSVVCVDHGGSAAGWYAAIPTADDSRIDLINADILDPAGSISIPAFASRNGLVSAHGRWVFLSQDGNTAYVVAQANAGAGLINDQGIATIDLTPPPSITITSPSHGSMLGSGFTVTYRTTSWPPLAGGSVAWSLDGVDQGAASGPLQLSGLSNGDHAIHLELRDHLGNTTGAADSISIQVRADRSALYRLATDVIDAEGDPVHGRVILVSAAPPAIHRWDAATRALTSCNLGAAPICVSVSPDGTTAVVGHRGSVSVIDLASMTQIASWPRAGSMADVIHGGGGFAYILPHASSQLQAINLSTGATSSTTGPLSGWWLLGRLRPGTTRLYVADSGTSPDNMECFDVSADPAQLLRLSPYWGDHPFGGNMWFNDQGSRFIAASGNVFRAGDGADTDMTYVGHIPNATGSICWADHGGIGVGKFVVIPTAARTRIDLINVDFLDAAGSKPIPALPVRGGPISALGRWVFLSQDGQTAHVVVQAGAGLMEDFGIATIDLAPPPSIAITSPASGATLGTAFSVSYRTTAWPPAPGGSVAWSLDGIDMGIATNPLHLSGLGTGDHDIRLELRDHLGLATGESDSITCHVLADEPGVFRLPCNVVDAENDPIHGRIVLVSTSPPSIYRWDTTTHTLSSCALSSTPTCVGVSPDGTSAVIGHGDRVSIVDLGSMTQVSVWPRNEGIRDIVHGGNGYAYILPNGTQWTSIHELNLTTGGETDAINASIYPTALGRLRPGSSALYLATGLQNPERIQRYSIAANPAQFVRQSPYWDTYPLGNNLWFNDQGSRFVTRSGNVFAADDAPASDMTYLGHMPTSTGGVVWADHGGGGAGIFAFIPAATDTRIDLTTADGLAAAGSRNIPSVTAIDGIVPTHGRWVFLSQDGDTAHVIAKAHDGSGLINDHIIATIDVTPQPNISIIAPADNFTFGSDFEVTFHTTAWPPIEGGSTAWALDGISQGAATSPILLAGLPTGDHTIRVELLDSNGVSIGVDDSITVHIIASQPDILRLDTDIVDAEGDPAHDRIILVGATPPRLYRWHSGTNNLVKCDLTAAPTCVSVSPDGTSAVVGHDGRISLINLDTMSQTASWLCATNILDVVHGGNGYAYVFPRTDQWVDIHCLNLTNGVDTPSIGSTYAGSLARLRPGTTALYQADNGVIPDRVQRYDISLGAARFQRDCPYWWTYHYGGNLWFNDQGTRFLARSGNFFVSSDDAATDMTFVGALPNGIDRVIWADHGGSGSGRFALIPSAADGRMDLVDADMLNLVGSLNLPAISVYGGSLPAHGRWVFLSADGLTAHGVVRASAKLHAIVSLNLQVPGASSVGMATAGDGQATVAFSPPSYAGLSPINGYQVTSTPGGITASGAGSPITVTGLNNGTTYTFTVTAINSTGAGPASAPSNAVTPRCAVVTYDANGGTGSIGSSLRTHGVPLTLSDGHGISLAGHAFAGWNTAADGSGASYPGGASFSGEVDVTLFAQWSDQSSSEPATGSGSQGGSQGCGAGALSGFLALGLLLGLRMQRRNRLATSA